MSFINQWLGFETRAYSQCEVGKTVLNTFCNLSRCQPACGKNPCQPIRINQGYEVTLSSHWVDWSVESIIRVSRVEAYQLLKEATTAAEAAQRALEHICGEDFNDASGEDLEARDKLVKKVQRNLLKLQKETQNRARHVKDPNKTFLSTYALRLSTFNEKNIFRHSLRRHSGQLGATLLLHFFRRRRRHRWRLNWFVPDTNIFLFVQHQSWLSMHR